MDIVVVTAAVVIEKGRVLLAQRKADANEALKWEFPGGKMEPGETPEECLAREIKEELAIDIEVEDIFKVVYHRYGERNILLLAYLCSKTGGVPVARDCNDFLWVEVADLMNYDLAGADIPIAAKIQGGSFNAQARTFI